MYKIVRENYERGTLIDKMFTRKTALLVQKHTTSSDIRPTLEVCEINETTLRRIEESKASETEKVFNLIKSIERTVEEQSGNSPYLFSIAEKAELLVKMYKMRQKNTQETLEELKKIIEEINDARKEQTEKNMSAENFTIYWMLKSEGFKDAEAMANEMRNLFEKYPHWQKSEKYEREIRTGIYQTITRSGVKDVKEIPEIVKKIMKTLKANREE
jgi:type I restriction enzyme R subunit